MALLNKIEPVKAQRALAAWLGRQYERPEVSNVTIPTSSGLSNETVLFDASWIEDGTERQRQLVARVQPAGPSVLPTYDIGREFRLMQALDGTDVPVPSALWYDSDPAVLGAPFMVMEHVAGRIPPDDPPFTAGGWVMELEPRDRSTVWDNGLNVLAGLHSTDWQALGLDFLNRPEHGARGVDQQIGYLEAFYEFAAEGKSSPIIDHALDWVGRHRPTDKARPVLNWGDARIGNIIFSDDLSVAAALDWELAELASPEADLAWWLIHFRYQTDASGVPIPEGIPSSADTVARYEELTGHRCEHLAFYEVLAALKLTIGMMRAGHLMIAAGLVPADNTMWLHNPPSQILAELLGIPAAEGEAQTFIGRR